jgi:hypothetical protein
VGDDRSSITKLRLRFIGLEIADRDADPEQGEEELHALLAGQGGRLTGAEPPDARPWNDREEAMPSGTTW